MASWTVEPGPGGNQFLPVYGGPAGPARYVTPPLQQARPEPPNRGDRVRYLKQRLIDRFAHYQLGLDPYTRYDEDAREPFVRALPIPPRQGPWPGHPPMNLVPAQIMARIEGPGRLAKLVPGRRVRKSPEREAAADRVAKLLRDDFRPARFKFRKRLGFGGFGAAFLFDMHSEKGDVVPIVVKASISQRRSRSKEMQDEKDNFIIMAGARHFVQRIVLQDLAMPAEKRSRMDRVKGFFSRLRGNRRGAREPGVDDDSDDEEDEEDDEDLADMYTPADYIRTARRTIDRRRDIIIMEYMSRGNLHNLILKVQASKAQLSSRMLWLILECLFKACIAMGHPLRFFPPDKDPWRESVPQREETAPRNGVLPDAPMVHFDIDPQNALVGEYGPEGDDHSFVPVVKIADPGLSMVVDRRFRRSENKVWGSRPCGKAEFFTPEQFTPEWEYEASRGLWELSRQETAGNYNWWSNLFQVGMIMWCIMSQHMPPMPPVAYPYKYRAEDGTGRAVRGHSYGLHLFHEEYDHIDGALRALVNRLLDHNPTQRPKMGYLEQYIACNLAREDLGAAEPDGELMANARRIFGDPP